MKKHIRVLVALVSLAMDGVAFAELPQAAKPWCYWWWLNGHGDAASVTRDLEAMADLGFGGLLMCDSRGYWVDDDHLLVPERKVEVMSPEWRRLVLHAIRECKRLGLKFTMNVATSGGKMSGPWKVGSDAPKRLMCRVYKPGEAFEKPDFPFVQEVAVFSLSAPADTMAPFLARGWYEAGDGTKSQVAGTRNAGGISEWVDVEVGVGEYRLRFIETILPGHDEDVDILDPQAVTRHFNRFTGALMDEAGADLVGADKTFAGIYSVSWEGVVPSWSPTFAKDFETFAGYKLHDYMPLLAGFQPAGTDPRAFMRDYRRARNAMFRENFYGTLQRLACERDVMMFSENGGPWNRAPELFQEADQLKFLAMNDMPQGEFWVREGKGLDTFWDEQHSDFAFVRGVVSAGHVYGKPRISMESFTHMTPHWSISPATLKRAIDRIFAAGANHVVWHTFTHSPEAFGVPGCEYFAGTHVNGNVTWHGEIKAFIAYLARCEALLQAGEPVVDIALKSGDTPYAGWGFFRDTAPDGTAIPKGYNYDLVNDEEWNKAKVANGMRVMGSGMRYPAVRPALPDLEGPWTFCHRRTADRDIYFVQGFEKGAAKFRTYRKFALRYNAVTDTAEPIFPIATADGRTFVDLDLTLTGSCFVIFSDDQLSSLNPRLPIFNAQCSTLNHSPWHVSFAYHKLNHTRHLPKPMTMEKLMDWTTSSDPDLKYFSGTATYQTTFELAAPGERRLSLGALPSGVAHVYVNGADCGTVWCAPWEATIPASALKAGTNELVIKYTNNWANRLIGDTFLEPAERVTTSNLQLIKGGKRKPNGKDLYAFSGYCSEDKLQPSGLLGPVTLQDPSAQADARWQSLLKVTPAELPAEHYLDFSRTGNRTRYEKPYHQRIITLERLTAEARRGHAAEMTPKIAEFLRALLSEQAWNLPAHDGDLKSWKGIELSVDLGCARRGLAVAEALKTVGDRLDKDLVAELRAALEKRVFAPCLATANGAKIKQHWWFHTANNWNAVCHSCVVRAALAYYPENAPERKTLIDAAVGAIPFFMDGFTDDGYCSEGAGYWNYGFGHFLEMGLALRKAPEKIDIFAMFPKSKTVARYGFDYRLTSVAAPRFADGGDAPNEGCLNLCRRIWPDLGQSAFQRANVFPIAQVFLSRPDSPGGLSAGYKGGHNDEFHNHNDLGSYVVAVGDAIVTGDPGGEVYTKRTFSRDRYVSKVLNSYAHPVPRIDGVLQGTGRKFAAKVVSSEFTETRDTVVLDLTAAYPATNLVSLVRTFVYDRSKSSFAVKDNVKFARPSSFEEPLVTLGAFGKDEITCSGKKLVVDTVVKGGAWSWAEETVENPGKTNPKLRLVRMPAVTEAEVTFTFH